MTSRLLLAKWVWFITDGVGALTEHLGYYSNISTEPQEDSFSLRGKTIALIMEN